MKIVKRVPELGGIKLMTVELAFTLRRTLLVNTSANKK